MIRRITFAALSTAIVLGAAAPAAGNVILGGYFGPSAADNKTPAAKTPADKAPAAAKKSDARNVKAAAPKGQHARSAKAAAPKNEQAGNVKAAATTGQGARTANASAAPAGQEDLDPRAAHMQKRKGGDQSWCDSNAQCNGWAQWLSDVESGKRKAAAQ